MALERYEIRRISNKLAMSVVIEEHYLHRAAPCTIAFGLFERNGRLVGVVCYGTPSSAPLRRGIAGDENSDNVAELTRLWVEDSVPRNGESFLIANTVRWAGKEFVVSFAEIEAGHVGTVYQAANWLYTGLSAKRTDWTVEGVNRHGQTLADKYTAAEMRFVFGDKFSLRERPRKHRYVWINARGARRRELMRALKYPIVAYPKRLAAVAAGA